jgi:hypothetical protein
VIMADGKGCHDAHRGRQGIDELSCAFLAWRKEKPGATFKGPMNLRRRHRFVFGVEQGVEIARQPRFYGAGQFASHENFRSCRHSTGAFDRDGWFLQSHCGRRGNGLPMLSTTR